MEISPISGALGAEISGIDISKKLTNTETQLLQENFLKFKVLFFRNQNLSAQTFVSFAKHFGNEFEFYFFLQRLQFYYSRARAPRPGERGVTVWDGEKENLVGGSTGFFFLCRVVRRLRQHNGELSGGGAPAAGRPWRILLVDLCAASPRRVMRSLSSGRGRSRTRAGTLRDSGV